MRVGRLKFNPGNDRYGIWWDNDWFHSGLHCGECLEVMLEGCWVQTRVEMAEGFFLIGTPYRNCLENIPVRFWEEWRYVQSDAQKLLSR